MVIDIYNENLDEELTPEDLNCVQMHMGHDDIEKLLVRLQAQEADDTIRVDNYWDDEFFTYTSAVLTSALEELKLEPPNAEYPAVLTSALAELKLEPPNVEYYFYAWW